MVSRLRFPTADGMITEPGAPRVVARDMVPLDPDAAAVTVHERSNEIQAEAHALRLVRDFL